MDQKDYLKRINYRGVPEPRLEVLKNLQKAHLLHIPFENLDIHHDRRIELDSEKIFNKIVQNGRGGFCYENNGLFHELLKSIGFEVKRISARVYDANKGYGFEYDHLVNLVRIDGVDYLADVGFGEFTFQPLVLELGTVQQDERGLFKIENHETPYFSVSKKTEDGWEPEYIFTTRERTYQEFGPMCKYHQTSPDSHFTQNKMITIPLENGRITLTEKKLKIRKGETIQEQDIHSKEEFAGKLWTHFKIRI